MKIPFAHVPFVVALTLNLGACSGGLTPQPSSDLSPPKSSTPPIGDQGAPVALTLKRAQPASVAMPLNADELAKAVERYRITKKKGESPFEQAGADLNGDGKAEAVVLFTGQEWCSPQGCTLVVFTPSEFGLRPVSQTVGIKPPIGAGSSSNAGWRDLIVKTGGSQTVRLQFSGGGYPANAAGQPDAAGDASQVEGLIPPQNQAQGNQTQGQGPTQTAASSSPMPK